MTEALVWPMVRKDRGTKGSSGQARQKNDFDLSLPGTQGSLPSDTTAGGSGYGAVNPRSFRTT